MVNIDTKQKIGAEYQVETDIPSRYCMYGNSEGALVVRRIRAVAHVVTAKLVHVWNNGELCVDLVLTVETHGDTPSLWEAIEKTVVESTPNVIK